MGSNKGPLALRGAAWLLGLAGGYVLAQGLLRERVPRKMSLVAHRGGAREAPESTAAAYRNALAQGVDTLELDIQMTSDGELVVFHDDTVDRTTDGGGPLAAKTLAEMKALDAGSWFGERWRGERVLTLRALIAIAKEGPHGGAGLLLEIKSPHLYPGIEEKMIAILEETGYMDKVLIMSFDGASLARVRESRPALSLCYLFVSAGLRPPDPPAGAGTLGPSWQGLLYNPAWVRQAHKAGMRVHVWTVNEPWAAHYLRAIGVDGITSDRPSMLREFAAAQDARPPSSGVMHKLST